MVRARAVCVLVRTETKGWRQQWGGQVKLGSVSWPTYWPRVIPTSIPIFQVRLCLVHIVYAESKAKRTTSCR